MLRRPIEEMRRSLGVDRRNDPQSVEGRRPIRDHLYDVENYPTRARLLDEELGRILAPSRLPAIACLLTHHQDGGDLPTVRRRDEQEQILWIDEVEARVGARGA